jgi:hypothetical protein
MPDATPQQFAAAVDASNNDDGMRLSTAIGTAVASTNTDSGQRVPDTNQAMQIAAGAGLPQTPESGRFLQVAAAMQLSPQQAQHVVQDVSSSGRIGPDVAAAIRQSLSGLTNRTGQNLNNGGMARAVGSLERAAQALVNTTQSSPAAMSESGDRSRQNKTAEKAIVGNPANTSANLLD